jgi:pimeloyl-ACP methyl ester carboxylesterase
VLIKGNIIIIEMGDALSTLLFQPPRPTPIKESKLIWLNTRQGSRIPAFFLERPGAKVTFLYSHANAEDIGTVYPWVKFLAKSLHVSILAYDYTGYGLSQPSIPSEENCYADIDAAYDYLVNERQILPENIVLYGRSLGSGPSCYLAARTAEAGSPVAGLILHAPFLSVFRVVFESGCTLIGDKFPNVDVAPYIRYDLFFISLLPIFESITPNCLFCIFLHIHHPSCQGALYL